MASTTRSLEDDPRSQQEVKLNMAPELRGQTWEFPPEELAKVLSAKTRKKDVQPHTLETIDVIENYDCHINDLNSELDTACRNFNGHSHLIGSNVESDHYHVLANFLNGCLTACRNALGDKANNAYHRDLEFFVWDKVMNDGIDGAHAVKPNLGSILRKSGEKVPPSKLFWSPPGDEAEMTVPVEVKADWKELVLQAGSYSRCLYSVSPLRPFNLVLAYHHTKRHLRFLVFHRGGLASSRDLDPFTPTGQKDILRLFLSLLTWKSPADAGFPSWYNGASISLPGREGEMLADVDAVLHSRTCVRGRAPHVLRVKLRNTKSSSSQVDSLACDTSSPAAPPMLNVVVPISISRSKAAKEPLVYVKHLVDWPEDSSIDINESIVLAVKLSYALGSRGQKNTIIEPRLLRECSGMFGIPKQFCSFVAHHQDGYPTTNHLFRPPPGKEKEYHWDDVFRVAYSPPELRSLIVNVTTFVGKSLVLAPDVSSLVQALVHAHLGYYNMCQRGFQHRDISIGNVLISDKAIPSKPFAIEQPTTIQKEILEICNKLGIKETCRGFLIDGDTAIDWDTHFSDKHDGSHSGTPEFMSKALLLEQVDDVIHSPVDDYWSFYFTAQWASVFREVPAGEGTRLQYLRRQLAGNGEARQTGTSTIVHEYLRVVHYGSFLTNIQPFLRDWNEAMNVLMRD